MIKVYHFPHYMIVMSHKYGSFGIQWDDIGYEDIEIKKEACEKGHNLLVENIVATPINLIEKLSDKKVLATAMQYLNDEERKVVILRHTDGMSFKEIAEVFQESINTVKSRYRRTLAVLRRNIKEN